MLAYPYTKAFHLPQAKSLHKEWYGGRVIKASCNDGPFVSVTFLPDFGPQLAQL